MTKKWFCLVCKKFVDTYIDYLKGFHVCCKECGSSNLMELDDVKTKEFKKMVEKFKKKTGNIEEKE